MRWTLPRPWWLSWTGKNALAYIASVVLVGTAALFANILTPLQAAPTLPFTAAVALTAWLFGRGPAVLAIMLSALAVDYFFLLPVGAVLSSLTEVVCVVYFTFVGGLICYLQENYRRMAVKLRQANEQLETRVQERTVELAAATESLESALNEKDVLLRELQHRVKNNLQVINSILSLQCGKLQDRASRECFRECQQRVRAIALVHERLYRTQNLDRIDVTAYFRELTQNLLRCYSVDSASVTIRVLVDEAAVQINHLIPCALIVNELVCNALKYAFPDGRAGEVAVELHRHNGQVTLRVSDNGVGCPLSDAGCGNGIGKQVVDALVHQLSGKLEWVSGQGTTATITFPETK